MEDLRAVIDIGTVTTRLLIADCREGSLRALVRRSVITQLGEGLTEGGTLSNAAISRVAGAVGEFVGLIEQHGARLVRCIATSASRDCRNRDDFERALSKVGVRPEVIAGAEEARLAYAGITSAFVGKGLLTCDVGGGSSELVFGDAPFGSAPQITLSHSFNIGSRRMTELYLSQDPPSMSDIARLQEDVEASMTADFFSLLPSAPSRLIAVAGSATTAVAIAKKMEPFDPEAVHGSQIGQAQLDGMVEQLASMPLESRRQVVGLSEKRAGVIVAGLAIISSIMRLSGLGEMTVSICDLLEGAILDSL